MPRDYLSTPRPVVRRQDRSVTDKAWIRAMLRAAPYGVLALSFEDEPVLNPNLFVYDEEGEAIYTHTAHVGRTAAVVEAEGGRPGCFSIFEMGRLIAADRALSFSTEYAGVMVFGRVHLLTGGDAFEALQQLMDKYAPHLRPGKDYEPATEKDLKRTAVYALAIEEWSGKQKAVAPDLPEAYHYADVARHTSVPASPSPDTPLP